jgi:hypothetical protein
MAQADLADSLRQAPKSLITTVRRTLWQENTLMLPRMQSHQAAGQGLGSEKHGNGRRSSVHKHPAGRPGSRRLPLKCWCACEILMRAEATGDCPHEPRLAGLHAGAGQPPAAPAACSSRFVTMLSPSMALQRRHDTLHSFDPAGPGALWEGRHHPAASVSHQLMRGWGGLLLCEHHALARRRLMLVHIFLGRRPLHDQGSQAKGQHLSFILPIITCKGPYMGHK